MTELTLETAKELVEYLRKYDTPGDYYQVIGTYPLIMLPPNNLRKIRRRTRRKKTGWLGGTLRNTSVAKIKIHRWEPAKIPTVEYTWHMYTDFDD